MTLARRLVLFAALVVIVFALGRSLVTFRTGRTSCGVVVAEAVASSRRPAPTPGPRSLSDLGRGSDLLSPSTTGGGFNAGAYDATVSRSFYSSCTLSARRRLLGDGVLAGGALIVAAGGLLILRRPAIR